MPIIPRIDEGQRLVPGSPVPVASAEGARKEGEAIAGVGQAIAQWGGAINEAANRARAEKSRLSVYEQEANFKLRALEARAKADAAAPVEGDTTGFGRVKQYQEELEEAQNELANALPDDASRKEFLIRSKSHVADTATSLLASEVKKRAEESKAMMGQLVSKNGAIARGNPELLEESMNTAEILIRESKDLPESDKNIQVIAARKSVLQDTIQGHLVRGSTGNMKEFKAAKATLEKYSGGIMTVEEKNKQFDEIDRAEQSFATKSLQRENLAMVNHEKGKKIFEQKKVNDYFTLLSNAGASEAAKAPIFAQIEKDVAADVISASKAQALMGNKTFGAAGSARTELKIMSEALRTGDFDKAINQMHAAAGDTVDIERAKKAAFALGRLKNDFAADPGKSVRVKENEEVLRSFAREAAAGRGETATAEEVDRAVSTYYKALEKPRVDPTTAMQYALETTGLSGRIKSGNKTMEQVTAEAQELYNKIALDKKAGTLGKDKEQELGRKLKELHLQRKKLELFQKTPIKPLEQPGTEPTGRRR